MLILKRTKILNVSPLFPLRNIFSGCVSERLLPNKRKLVNLLNKVPRAAKRGVVSRRGFVWITAQDRTRKVVVMECHKGPWELIKDRKSYKG